MKRRLLPVLVCFVLLPLARCVAQEIPEASRPTEHHEWLNKFVGDWDVVSGGAMGEDQPEMQGKASMHSSMLGGLWLVNASEHDLNGQKLKSIQMIGFDTDKGKYVGIWADSMVNHMWHYEGALNEAGNKLVLEAEGPSMQGDGKMILYRDSYEFADDDTIIAVSEMQGPSGEWVQIMKGEAKRRK